MSLHQYDDYDNNIANLCFPKPMTYRLSHLSPSSNHLIAYIKPPASHHLRSPAPLYVTPGSVYMHFFIYVLFSSPSKVSSMRRVSITIRQFKKTYSEKYGCI